MALQESFSRTEDFTSGLQSVHSTQKINDMSYNQLTSDHSAYVKKRAQRSDDSILLRHLDDVVGTGPEEHLMSNFEHMKTSLYLTCAMKATQSTSGVFRSSGHAKALRGKSIQTSWNPESICTGYKTPKPTVNPGRRSTVMELASATPLDGHDCSNFCTAVGKSSSWHAGDQTCNSPSNNYPHKSSTPRQRASAQ